MLNIDIERLKELLSDAYESGWSGCLDLKSEYVDQVLEKIKDNGDFHYSSTLTVDSGACASFSTSTIGGISDSQTTFIPGYYSYFGNTSPTETVFLNEPGEEAI